MKTRFILLAATVAGSLHGGCAAPNDPEAGAQPQAEGAYITGSRIPARDTTGAAPVNRVSPEDWQSQRRGESGRATKGGQ